MHLPYPSLHARYFAFYALCAHAGLCRIVESTDARMFGLNDAEVQKRRRYVGHVRKEIEVCVVYDTQPRISPPSPLPSRPVASGVPYVTHIFVPMSNPQNVEYASERILRFPTAGATTTAFKQRQRQWVWYATSPYPSASRPRFTVRREVRRGPPVSMGKAGAAGVYCSRNKP